MEKTIKIPEGIECSVEGFKVKVKGKLGELERNLYNKEIANILKIEKSEDKIKISSILENKKGKALLGTMAAHILNLFEGVESGYKYKLKVVYTHFPLSIKKEGEEIVVSNFLGQKGTKKMNLPADIKVEIKKDEIEVSGINKELAGQTAADMEKLTKLRGKDRRRFQDGIFIFEKPKN
jgi:large subunit ribosomal protein L6